MSIVAPVEKAAHQGELLAFQVLPAAWMGFCLEVFRHREPSAEYANSAAFLFLGLIWLFNRKQWKQALLAGRARTWGMAAAFCVTGLLTGLVFFVLFPIGWAFWFVFFPGLAVLIGTTQVSGSARR